MQFRFPLAAVALVALAGCTTTAPDGSETPAGPVRVQILAINDFHGNLETPQSETSWIAADGERRARLGGGAQLGTMLAQLRSGASITVAAGDLIGASPLASSLFLDEPSIRLLSEVGLDLAAVGNHEFDRGIDELRRMQAGGCEQFTLREPCALEPFIGADFTYLAANVVDEVGDPIFPGAVIRDVGGVRIGFIGMTLEGTASLVAAQATAGYVFLDEAETANAWARRLREHGADTVVVLIHEGADVDPNFNLLGCPGLGGPIVGIVQNLDPAISIVISGHTHQAYSCMVPTSAGSEVLLTSAGRYGAFVTEIAMVIDPATDAIISLEPANRPVPGDLAALPVADAIVRRYVEAAGPVANRPVGPIADTGAQGNDCADTPAQGFVADAYLAGARTAMGGDVDFAFVNSGGVRTDLAGAADGMLTFGELSAMAPFGNGIAVLWMTGTDVAALLEQQFCTRDGSTVVCQSRLIGSANFTYTVDPSRPAGERVVEMLLDGVPLNMDETYRVATNSFLAGGGDDFTRFVEHGPAEMTGFDLDALEAYVATGTVTVPICGRVRSVILD